MDDLPEDLRDEAAAWLARMHSPDAEQLRPAFDAWRAASPEHDLAYHQLQWRWEQMRFAGNLGIVRDRNLSRAQLWHRRPAVRGITAAGAVLLALGGAGLIVHGTAPVPGASRSIAYETPLGQVRSIALADGTRVTLDANSAIRVAYVSAERRAELVRGRARFSVPGTDSRPFVVIARELTVSGQNADFDIDLAPFAPRVALLRGDAEVRGSGATGQPATLWRLRSGQQIVPGRGAVPQAAAAGTFQWTSGMLSFDGERLDDAIAAFNRYNRTRIALADPATGALKVTGAFHANDPLGFAAAVATMFHFHLDDRHTGLVTLSQAKKS